MRDVFIPRPYQPIAVNHIYEHKRSGLFLPMGMGKTTATAKALVDLSCVEDIFPALILAPLRVARDTWPEAFARWDIFDGVGISPVIGDNAQRMRALRKSSEFYSTNFENIPWLVEKLEGEWPFKSVIVDESTKLKGFRLKQGTQRARALARFAHSKVRRWVNLTGTPSPNGLKDLWGQTWFLDGGQRLGRTFTAFTQRWFRPDYSGFGIEPLPHAQAEIMALIADICLSMEAKDWFDIKEPIVNDIYVDLPFRARDIYKRMEKEMFAEIEGHGVEAFNAASRTGKCLQLANGAAYVEGTNDRWVDVHDAKIEALESIIEEANGMPVMCAYNFVSDRVRLLKHFKGSVDLATKEGLAKFKAGKAALGIGHPASIGHGIDGLQNVTNILAFFGHDWNYENYAQIIERIGPVRQLQAGLDRPVFIHHIIARDTVDELVMKRRDGKRSVQDILMEALKERKPR